MILETMQRVFHTAQIFEEEFAEKQMLHYSTVKKQEIVAKRKELSKAKKRITEIDGLILKLYEDNTKGKFSDERYAAMSEALEREQAKLKDMVPEAEAFLSVQTDQSDNLQRFIERVKSMTEPKELTAELVHEYIEKIVVYVQKQVDGKRVQLLDVCFNGVGIVQPMTPEEMEGAF